MGFDYLREKMRAAFEKIGRNWHIAECFTDIDSYFNIITSNGSVNFFFKLQPDGLSTIRSVEFYSEYVNYPRLIEPTHGLTSWLISPFSEKNEPHTSCPVCTCQGMKIFEGRAKCCSCNTEFNLSFKMFFS